MKSYNVKCLGCGAFLNDDPNQIGYVEKFEENKTRYCKRCFRLINYGEIDNSNLNVNAIYDEVKRIDLDKSVYIFHVVDVLDLSHTVLKEFINHQDKLCFVVNKMDCLPQRYNAQLTAEMIENTIKSFGYTNPKILYCSANNKTSIKRLFDAVKKTKDRKLKAMFVGCSNVGKSSLINRMCELNDVRPQLTISPYVNTTILLQKVKIDKFEIIDTPGLPVPNNILNYLTAKDVKKVMNYKNVRPINFSINPDQTLMLEGLARIDYVEGNKASFTFYTSNELKIQRMKTENADKNFLRRQELAQIQYNVENPEFETHEFELNPERKHNLNISGLGLITLNKGISKIKVTVLKQVGVSITNYAII